MAAAVVSVVVEDSLQSLREGRIGPQWGVKHELAKIYDLLYSIREVLTEAENKYGHSFELQERVRKLKEAAFSGEDLLEELSVEKGLWQRKRRVSRLFQPLVTLKFRWRMRKKLKAVVEQLQYLITSDWISFIRNIPSEIGEADEEARTVPLIGRDYVKGELMRLLLGRGWERKRDLPVLRILGDGGFGKTALVQEVLSESELSGHFDNIIWVDASPPFNENMMARAIIAGLTKDGATEEDNVLELPLIQRIRKFLDRRKKYLFILDNLLVQDSERRRWERFWSYLKRGATGSEIIVTTRDPTRISFEDMGRERKPDLPVLTVYGSGGIGKTALVREVCSELELNWHFDDIIWVKASPPFDETRMARDIISSLTKGGATEEENVVEEQLLAGIGKLLDGRKKYLFILDDLSVHDRQRWLRFWSFLEGGATGSKIIVTTRDPIVIYYEESVLYLGGLTQEDSRDLLLKTASKGRVGEIIDPAKLKIAKEVAAKYHGNPLIIRSVGDYLSLQHDVSDWSYFRDWVNDSVLSTLLYGGYPYGHLDPMVKKCNDLPSRIKQCFGLCSLFPRGHSIDRLTLAELWIALGYIKSSNNNHQPFEDIADEYIDQLLKEELFQVKKFDPFGKVRSVVLHPDAEGLARSVAGWECAACMWNETLWKKELGKALHISIINYWNFSWYHYSYTELQTVLHFVDDASICEAMLNNIIPYLKNARVLDLHHRNVETVHKGVGKMKLLRYLDISDNRRIEKLPPAITGLPNLQTLKLSGCWALKELPLDMRKMVALRHLYIDGCRKLSFMPKGLGDLKFLSILTDFILPPDDSSSVDSANLADLCKLNDLRGSLRITNLGYPEYEHKAARKRLKIQGMLNEKSSLESLELIFRNLRTDGSLLDQLRPHQNLKGLKIHNYGETLFPSWMAQPLTNLPNLVEIALIGCKNCECLPLFGQLRHLKSLTIQGLPNLLRMESAPEQSSPDVANNTQPSSELSSLCIRDCPKLECLMKVPRLAKLTLANVSEQLFGHPFYASSLKTLRLENIELLHHLPEEWLRDLISLEELHIRSCPKLNGLSMTIPSLVKMTLANVSEELFWKPCHLPSLNTLRLENIELLHHLPEEWLRDLTSLKELHIGSCPSLVSLSQGIMHLENLESLSIWNCKELDLSKDENGNVMMKLQGLRSLKFLTIYKASKMKDLPEWLSRVYTLRFLCIRSCPNLVKLPMWITNLRSLELLELVHCPKLTFLPEGIYEFNNNNPRKLSIVGCPLLKANGIKHSRRL